MSTSGAEGDPYRPPIELLGDSYARVAGVFQGVEYSWEAGRGGIDRPGKEARTSRVVSADPPTPDFHVEATFNEAQLEYVGLCIAGLNKLTRGEVLRSREKLPTLRERVQGHFLHKRGPAYLRFGISVAVSTVALFDEFGTRYPNLTPALAEMSRVGGKAGVAMAAGKSEELLRVALDQVNGGSQTQRLVPGLTGEDFIGFHTEDGRSGKTGPYEVWCIGEAFGRSIIREAGEAALTLTRSRKVKRQYNPLEGYASVNGWWLGDQLDASIGRSLQAARSASPDTGHSEPA